MIIEKPLRTPRLSLRTLFSGDAESAYLRWMQDPVVLRYLEVRHSPPGTSKELAEFILAANEHPAVLLLGICLESGRHIGNAKLNIDWHHRRADLGFLIGERTCWGQGYASEAVGRMATHGLEELGLTKIIAGCYCPNAASARVLERAGFALEATLRAHWYLDGRPCDGLLYARHHNSLAA